MAFIFGREIVCVPDGEHANAIMIEVHSLFINKQTRTIAETFRNFPRRYYIFGASLFAMVLITGVFWPRQVTFSYAGKTCFYQPTVAPGLLRSQSDRFRLEADQRLSVAGVTVAALNMCIVPIKAPEKGTTAAALSLTGLAWLQKQYVITTPDPPGVSAYALGKKPLSVSQVATIPLATIDNVFTYKVQVNGKIATCPVDDQRLICDLPALSLRQGSEYTVELQRYFNDTKVAVVANQPIKTLTATTITSASITNGQIVYAKPKSIELTADKSLVSGAVIFERVEGEKRTEIPTQTTYEGNKATISWTDDLPRQAKFELAVSKLAGADGSGLDDVYRVPFETSGGPKVKSISVGTYKVPMGTTATITFDQPIMASQDLTNVVTTTGGAIVTGKTGNQVLVSFANVPRCGDVTVAVGDSLQSDQGVSGGSAWRYSTRTICQVQSAIGSSVKGRSITAYSFGSGTNTIVYTGTIHGNEVSTRALMLRWIDELEMNPRSIPVDKTVVIIPVANPDGYAVGTRTNANNVDLNRNFATSDWRSDITTTDNTPFPGGGGKTALSEPESQALAGYVARLKPRLVLSYHSIGGLLVANQAGDSLTRASTYARLSGYSNTTGVSNTFDYSVSGTADDYYGEVLGVSSVLIELGSHTDPQFARNRDAMWAMIK